MNKVIQVGTPVVVGFPNWLSWLIENEPALKVLKGSAIIQGVTIKAKNRGAMEIEVNYIAKDLEKNHDPR